MAEITFVIPARNLDTLHRLLSMLSFQKGGALRVVYKSATVIKMPGEFFDRHSRTVHDLAVEYGIAVGRHESLHSNADAQYAFIGNTK
jgi:hypothetical protein